VGQLTKAECKKVFREGRSGTKTDRAQLRRLLGQLEAGDVLTVTRLDRLARSTRDLLNTLATVTGKTAGFRSLGDAWADATTSHGRLMLTVLGGLAQFERDLNLGAHRRGPRAREGSGREDGTRAEAYRAPDEGSTTPPRSGRADARHREKASTSGTARFRGLLRRTTRFQLERQSMATETGQTARRKITKHS
jgi:DNA invertase Pin-like site-specific DNA recombinase